MSSSVETLQEKSASVPVRGKAKEGLFLRFLDFISSVRFGVFMLVLAGLFCLIGMLVMQENVSGFDNYYASLTPAQQLVYGKLDFFDIYHAWYFNVALAILSLNIILSTIERLPKTIAQAKANLTVPVRWLQDQNPSETLEFKGAKENIVHRISEGFKEAGWKNPKIAEKGGKTYIFAETNKWNRFGYVAVHVGLLTIFAGGFLTAQFGQTGNMPLKPGTVSNQIIESEFDLDRVRDVAKQLPFEIVCTDIRQKLIKDDGSINAGNTIDWLTHFQIKDETGTHDAHVQMNKPFDYRGYRFFQASFAPVGRARNITLRLTPENGGQPLEVTIPRDGAADLPDGTKVKFSEFRANFTLGRENPNEDTTNYPNPGVILQVTPPDGAPQAAYAFGEKMANLPVAKKPVAGYTYRLTDFEKVSDRHILSVQRDPGSNIVYIGFAILTLTLVAVFFFSHQRVWAAVTENSPGDFTAVIAGNTNRNQNGFEEKYKGFIETLKGTQ